MNNKDWLFLCLQIAELVICQARLESGWNSAPNTQYHIQTDEGEERYFRYQTLTGQYRKEKRLQDGSVVGTYGWVDADGWLRLKDYVADDQGYRIVRSKKLYVGANPAVDSAAQPSKYVPSPAVPAAPYKPAYDYVPVVDNSLSSTAAPYSHDYHVPAVSSTAAPYNSHEYNVPSVSSTAAPYNFHEHYAPSVSTTLAPPPSYAVSTTESPYTVSSTASPYAVSSTPSYPSDSTPSPYAPSSTVSPYSRNDYYASPVTDNSIISSTPASYKGDVYDDYLNSKSYVSQTEKSIEFPSSNMGPISLEDYLKSGSEHVQREVAITPHYRFSVSATPTPPSPMYEKSTEAPRPVTFRPYYNLNVVSSGFQYGDRNPHKDVEYDGVSLTHDGFKYYLPKHYHEEEGSSSSHRAGSFGYVDPFGIRRVIYYNTSPEKGFVHRKNNRYVGFDAPPYDPRF